MATVKRHRKDRHGNDRWQVRYRDHEGKQRAKTFEKKAEANHFRDTVAADVRRDDYIDPELGRTPLGEFAERWTATRGHLAQSTQDQDRHYLSSLILPAFAERPVSSIRQSEIAAWVSRLDAAPATKTKALQKLSAILRLAVADGALKKNPADGVTRPKLRSREGRALSNAEVAKIIDTAEQVDPDTAAMVWCMARGGLRIGEVLALKRSDVDLGSRMLHIGGSMSRREGVRPAKNDSERSIPMAADLTERLREHLDRTVASIEGWLFTAPMGGRVRYGNWRKRRWNKITELADIGEVHPHDLRHTAATRLFVEDGWTVPQVQSFLGHADPAITLRIYTHVVSEELPEPSSAQSVHIQVQ